MSISRWERFKWWWNTPRPTEFHNAMIECDKLYRDENLRKEESRLCKQIEQLSAAMINSHLRGSVSTLRAIMIDELMEVQKKRLGATDSDN